MALNLAREDYCLRLYAAGLRLWRDELSNNMRRLRRFPAFQARGAVATLDGLGPDSRPLVALACMRSFHRRAARIAGFKPEAEDERWFAAVSSASQDLWADSWADRLRMGQSARQSLFEAILASFLEFGDSPPRIDHEGISLCRRASPHEAMVFFDFTYPLGDANVHVSIKQDGILLGTTSFLELMGLGKSTISLGPADSATEVAVHLRAVLREVVDIAFDCLSGISLDAKAC